MASETIPRIDGQPAASAPQDAPWPSTLSSYYTIFVFAIVVMFTVIDRQVLGLMIEPIKHDFQISDTKAALLLGAAFSLTYAIAGLPIARIADRANRRNLIAICLASWSAATVACGFAQNYPQLFLARLGIGVGEAGYAPAVWSTVTDSFPREKVAFATGSIAIGGHLGTGLALIVGGSVFGIVSQWPPTELPLVGIMRPWQWVFIIVGAPGLLWALMVMTLREPPRRGLARTARVSVPAMDVVRYMANDWRTYTAIIGGMAIKSLMGVGNAQWIPTLFYREYGWSLAKIGLTQGAIVMAIGPIGLVLGGKLSQWLHRRGMGDADMRIVFYASCATFPISIMLPLAGNPALALVLFGVNTLIGSLAYGPGTAAFQLITPNRMRAQVSAVYMFCYNVVGFAFGPLVVALFTDYLFHDPQDLKYSMALCTAILGPIAFLVTLQGLKPYARSYARSVQETGG